MKSDERGTTIAELLDSAVHGDRKAAVDLLPVVYEELRALAQARLLRENQGQTLQSTALVHEAYLRLVGEGDRGWNSKGHFFGAAALAMRRILVDRAREKLALKRGGAMKRQRLTHVEPAAQEAQNLLDLDGALGELEEQDQQASTLVQLRYFAGIPLGDAARLMGISESTAKRTWSFTRRWLFLRVGDLTALPSKD